MKAGFVFDLDGTLVDSLPGIAKGLNLALASLGFPQHCEQDIRMMVGKGAHELCRSALSASFGNAPERVTDESIASLLEAFMREYPLTWREGTAIYPGIEPLLAELRQQGSPLAVLSNKPHVVTEPLVRQLFPHIGFSTIMGYSDRFPRKPDPSALLHIVDQWQMEPGQVTMIGDTTHDAETATNANCQLVLVGWGYAIRSRLVGIHAPLCDTVEELRKRLLSYAGG